MAKSRKVIIRWGRHTYYGYEEMAGVYKAKNMTEKIHLEAYDIQTSPGCWETHYYIRKSNKELKEIYGVHISRVR